MIIHIYLQKTLNRVAVRFKTSLCMYKVFSTDLFLAMIYHFPLDFAARLHISNFVINHFFETPILFDILVYFIVLPFGAQSWYTDSQNHHSASNQGKNRLDIEGNYARCVNV